MDTHNYYSQFYPHNQLNFSNKVNLPDVKEMPEAYEISKPGNSKNTKKSEKPGKEKLAVKAFSNMKEIERMMSECIELF